MAGVYARTKRVGAEKPVDLRGSANKSAERFTRSAPWLSVGGQGGAYASAAAWPGSLT